jgi:hypothetical protein
VLIRVLSSCAEASSGGDGGGDAGAGAAAGGGGDGQSGGDDVAGGGGGDDDDALAVNALSAVEQLAREPGRTLDALCTPQGARGARRERAGPAWQGLPPRLAG